MFRFVLMFLVAHVLSSSVSGSMVAEPIELLRIGIGSANTIDWENRQDRLWVGGSRGLWVFDSQLELVEQYTDTDYSIRSISWNNQSTRLAVGDNEGTIRVHTYDGEFLSPEPVITIHTEWSNITQITWSLDGVYLAAKSGRRDVGIWFSETGNNIDLPQMIDSIPVTALKWSPVNNTEIGFTSLTEGIIIWDVETQTVNRAVPEVPLSNISWSQSGKVAAASIGDLYIWEDSLLGEPLQITTLDDGRILSVDWSSDNESVVATGSSGDIYIWTIDGIDIQSASVDYSESTALWSPNNDYIAVVGAGDSLQLRDSTNLNELARFDEFNSTILEVDWHPNGTQIATIWGRFSQEIRIFDAQTGQMTLRIPRSFTYTLAWNPDGTIIASSPSNVELLLHDALSGNVLDTLQGSDDGWFLFSMDWNPDGDMLATSNGDDVSIWSVDKREEINRLQGHTDTVTSVDWSPNGALIASTGVDDTVRIWDVSVGEQVTEFSGIASAVWSPDGTRIASFDTTNTETIVIRDTQNYTIILNLTGDEGVLQNISWNADGEMIAAGSTNHFVYIWDAVDGELLHVIDAHTSGVSFVDWHPATNLLAIASHDGTVTIWSI